ncbi:hypothetical protein FRC10_011760 [Ceratobasidium sp. 414]|nr:hypothetical protein FRC10_011760 [Ceratobasidium sp. 414]
MAKLERMTIAYIYYTRTPRATVASQTDASVAAPTSSHLRSRFAPDTHSTNLLPHSAYSNSAYSSSSSNSVDYNDPASGPTNSIASLLFPRSHQDSKPPTQPRSSTSVHPDATRAHTPFAGPPRAESRPGARPQLACTAEEAQLQVQESGTAPEPDVEPKSACWAVDREEVRTAIHVEVEDREEVRIPTEEGSEVVVCSGWVMMRREDSAIVYETEAVQEAERTSSAVRIWTAQQDRLLRKPNYATEMFPYLASLVPQHVV